MRILKEGYRTYRIDVQDAEYLLDDVADNVTNYLNNLFNVNFQASVDVSVEVRNESLIIRGLPDVRGDLDKQHAMKNFIRIALHNSLDLSKIDYDVQFINDGVILIVIEFHPIDLFDYYLKAYSFR